MFFIRGKDIGGSHVARLFSWRSVFVKLSKKDKRDARDQATRSRKKLPGRIRINWEEKTWRFARAGAVNVNWKVEIKIRNERQSEKEKKNIPNQLIIIFEYRVFPFSPRYRVSLSPCLCSSVRIDHCTSRTFGKCPEFSIKGRIDSICATTNNSRSVFIIAGRKEIGLNIHGMSTELFERRTKTGIFNYHFIW